MTLVTGAGVFGSGAITNASGSSASLTINQAAASTYSGAIGGPASGAASAKDIAFTKLGAGNLTLSGTNTYSGATTIGQGTLRVSGGAAIPDTSDVTIASAGTLNLAN